MKVNYYLAEVCGHSTAIVMDSFNSEEFKRISAGILSDKSIFAENTANIQKPLLKTSRSRIRIPGDGFCANALLGFASMLVLKDMYAPKSGIIKVPVEMSGYDGTLTVAVIPESEKSALVTADIPLPMRILHLNETFSKISVVQMHGITHVVFWDVIEPNIRLILPIREILKNNSIDSKRTGLMFFNKSSLSLRPFICDENAGVFREVSSCGSGTAAVAAAFSSLTGKGVQALPLKQKGGTITAYVSSDKDVFSSVGISALVTISSLKETEI